MIREKLKECFDGMIVKKGDQDIFSSMNIPSFLRDWMLRKYADEDGNINAVEIKKNLQRIMPSKDDWQSVLDRMMNSGEVVKFLAKIVIKIDTSKGEVRFTLPDFDISEKQTYIPSAVWEKCKSNILGINGELWGIVDIKYELLDVGKTSQGKIVLVNFQNFRPYKIDLEYFKVMRAKFTIDEWLELLLGAIDYNYYGYKDDEERLMVLTRLLPSVENRLNFVELAPKGTGKSYIFSQINKRGWLSTGGVMTRAKMFYDMRYKMEGLVSMYDYVALDEISTISFPNIDEMRGSLKGYMENGKYTVGVKSGSGQAGIIILGNISHERMDVSKNMFKELPVLFKDSALIDRFHGFIEGWKIPRMRESFKVKDWALNTEYFAEIMHQLRFDITYKNLVDKLILVPDDADTRDTTAVKRICVAFIKLLFPHWQTLDDVNIEEFETYCFNRAINMRKIVKKQLEIMDSEYALRKFGEYKVNYEERK